MPALQQPKCAGACKCAHRRRTRRAPNYGACPAAGVIAEPHTSLTDLTADDSFLVVCSDGLLANEERGGGGGLRCGTAGAGGLAGARERAKLGNTSHARRAAASAAMHCRIAAASSPHPACPSALLLPPAAGPLPSPFSHHTHTHTPCSNEEIADTCVKMAGQSCDAIAAELGKNAVAAGTTDDVTVLVLKLKVRVWGGFGGFVSARHACICVSLNAPPQDSCTATSAAR